MDVDMDARLADMPILSQRPDHIDAVVFNVWRPPRRRWCSPLRLDDLGLPHM